MTDVNYGLHFMLLLFAGVALTIWGEPIHGAIPLDRFHAHFALVGALQAMAWVLALRGTAQLERRIAFVMIVSALSIGAAYVGLAFVFLVAEMRSLDGKTVFALAAGSAGGASAYWIAIRMFWLPRLKLTSLAVTAVFCTLATLLAVAVIGWANAPRRADSMQDVDVLTFFWWAAFSSSILLADRGWLTSKWSRRRAAVSS